MLLFHPQFSPNVAISNSCGPIQLPMCRVLVILHILRDIWDIHEGLANQGPAVLLQWQWRQVGHPMSTKVTGSPLTALGVQVHCTKIKHIPRHQQWAFIQARQVFLLIAMEGRVMEGLRGDSTGQLRTPRLMVYSEIWCWECLQTTSSEAVGWTQNVRSSVLL